MSEANSLGDLLTFPPGSVKPRQLLIEAETAGLRADLEVEIAVGDMHPQVLQEHPGDCPICGMKSETPAAFSIVTALWHKLLNEISLASRAWLRPLPVLLCPRGSARRIRTAYSKKMTLYLSAIGVDQIFASYRRRTDRNS